MGGVAGGLETKPILNEVGIPKKLKTRSDSAAARGISHRRGVGRVRHLNIEDLWVQEKVEGGSLTIEKVDTRENKGDIGTKPLDGSKLTHLLSLTSLERVSSLCAGGIFATLLFEHAEGAGTEVQRMIIGSSVGWVVDAVLDHVKDVLTARAEWRS